MAIVDATGAVQKSYTYDVYGEPTATGTLANEFDFAGQQTDPAGLQYLRARYMDPRTGTFISRDPFGSSPGWLESAYQYASASPAGLSDPQGLSSTPGEGPGNEYDCNIGWCFYSSYPTQVFSTSWGAISLTLPAGQWWERYGKTSRFRGCWHINEYGAKECQEYDLEAEGKGVYVRDLGQWVDDLFLALGMVSGPRIKFGHGYRHLPRAGLNQAEVENAIRADVRASVGEQDPSKVGDFWGRVVVDGKTVTYRAKGLEDGTINVGTYYPDP